jgi:hypothetical protein
LFFGIKLDNSWLYLNNFSPTPGENNISKYLARQNTAPPVRRNMHEYGRGVGICRNGQKRPSDPAEFAVGFFLALLYFRESLLSAVPTVKVTNEKDFLSNLRG